MYCTLNGLHFGTEYIYTLLLHTIHIHLQTNDIFLRTPLIEKHDRICAAPGHESSLSTEYTLSNKNIDGTLSNNQLPAAKRSQVTQ